jgi:hypothetical protein
VTVYLDGGSSGGQHMTLCEVEVYACGGGNGPACQPVPPAPPTNYARSQPASQSSEGWDGSPSRGVDGNTNGAYGGGSCTHTNASPSWWMVDLGDPIVVSSVAITHRTDCCQDRLVGAVVSVIYAPELDPQACGALSEPSNNPEVAECDNLSGQYVRVYMDGGSSGGQHMTLCEVEVYACEDCDVVVPDGYVPMVNIAEGQPASQSSEGWGGSPGRGVDGNVNGAYGAGTCTHTNASPSWWQVDLGSTQTVVAVDVTHRTDCCQDRLVTADILVSAAADYSAGTACGILSNPSSNPERSVCPNAEGQFVTVYLDGGSSGGQHMTLCEVQVYACGGDGQPACEPVPPAPPPNLARSQPATQSTEGWGGAPGRAVDGNTNGQYGGGSCTHTNGGGSWWQVDLGSSAPVDTVTVYHRTDCCQDRLSGARILVSATADYSDSTECGTLGGGGVDDIDCGNAEGQFVTVSMDGAHMTLCEVEVTGGGR